MFEVDFRFPTHGDDGLIRLVAAVSRRLPDVLHASIGASSFRPPRDALLALEIFGVDAADAVTEATAKVRQAFSEESQPMPAGFSVEAKPAMELEERSS